MIDYAGGSLLLTALYTALIVWIVGLAVPVTASYIICAVIAAPALIKLGVPDFAAHMFIFYYAVLSEVSPPTALSPFAAAAITGGDPYKTTMQAWKYTLPAFLVPFVFVLDPQGLGLLLKVPKDGSLGRHRRDHGQDRARPRRAGRGGAGLGAAPNHARRARAADRSPGLLLVFPSLIEGILEAIIGRDISYTATFGLVIAAAVLLKQRMQPAPPKRRPPADKTNKRAKGDTMTKRKGLIFGALVAGAALCGGIALAQQQTTIAIATGGTGGVYYPLGGGMANVLTKYVPGYAATARVTGGSVDNLKLIGSKQSEVAHGDGRRRARRAQGRGQVQGQSGRRPHADGALSEPHACGVDRRQGHREDVRPQGQARLDRLARQRHRGDGVPRHRGRRSRQGQGHAARAARRRRVHQRAQGRQDRRLLLGRRAADRGGDRSRRHARRQDQDGRSRRRASTR